MRCILDDARTNHEIHEARTDRIEGWALCGKRVALAKRVPWYGRTFVALGTTINPGVERHYVGTWRAERWLSHARETQLEPLCPQCGDALQKALHASVKPQTDAT